MYSQDEQRDYKYSESPRHCDGGGGGGWGVLEKVQFCAIALFHALFFFMQRPRTVAAPVQWA